MIFKKGFEFNGVKYGWNKKNLYRLPVQIGKRFYAIKKMKQQLIGTTWVWNVYKHTMTKNQLKQLTKDVNWKVKENISPDCPF